MAWNFKRELARKSVHFLSIFILAIYFLIYDLVRKEIALLTLVLILIIVLGLEYIRLESKKQVNTLNKIWNYLRRKSEENKIGGEVFFLIGAIMVLAIFDIRIAVAGILMATFGDLTAALVGSKFGKTPFGNLKQKTWEGALSQLFINILVGALVFLFLFEPSHKLIWIVFISMALTATAIETITNKIDDNLLIPIVSCFVGQTLLFALNSFV